MRRACCFPVLLSGDLHLQVEGLRKVREAEVALVVKPCLLREKFERDRGFWVKAASLVGSWFPVPVQDRRLFLWTARNTSLNKRRCQPCLLPSHCCAMRAQGCTPLASKLLT